jgi:hypothetical protein
LKDSCHLLAFATSLGRHHLIYSLMRATEGGLRILDRLPVGPRSRVT